MNAQKARNLLLRRLVHSINAAEVRHLDLFLKFDLRRRFFRALRTSSENRPSACLTAIRRHCQLPRLPEHTPTIFRSYHQSRSYLVRSAKPLQSTPYSASIFPLQASTKDLIPKSTTITPLPWFHEQPINQLLSFYNMDSETVHCAYRLLRLLESHHQLSRSFDHLTRQLITLITQSAAPPIEPLLEPTKESVQADLKYLADTVYKQAIRVPALPITTEIHQTIISAIDKCFASPPPLPALAPAPVPTLMSTNPLLQGITYIEEQVKKLLAKQLSKFPTAEDIATQLEPKICQSIRSTMSNIILDYFGPLPQQQYTNQPPRQYAYQPPPQQPQPASRPSTDLGHQSWW